jgi:hypothetical protein
MTKEQQDALNAVRGTYTAHSHHEMRAGRYWTEDIGHVLKCVDLLEAKITELNVMLAECLE